MKNKKLKKIIVNNDVKSLKKLLSERKIDPTENNNFALSYACEKGLINIVKILLLDDRINPTCNLSNSLRKASENGHTEVVKLLINDNRVDPFIYNGISLFLAIKNDNQDTADLFLDKKYTPYIKNTFFSYLNDFNLTIIQKLYKYVDKKTIYDAIILSFNNENEKIYSFLFNLRIVDNILIENNIEIFNTLIKNQVAKKIINFN